MTARFNGGFFSGLLKAFLGGESLFVNDFQNNTSGTRRSLWSKEHQARSTKSNSTAMKSVFNPEPSGINHRAQIGVKWAGIRSWFAREGLFKLSVKGQGTLGMAPMVVSSKCTSMGNTSSIRLIWWHTNRKCNCASNWQAGSFPAFSAAKAL